MVGEIKKRKYIHYHCAGHKRKCGEPYTREELLEERFTALLKKPLFDDDVFDRMRQALTESRADAKREHAEAVARLEKERGRLRQRIDAIHIDRLDGKI